MNPELKDVAERMKDLGLGALTHALRLSLYGYPGNPSWGDLSVLNAAHAAEILIKARLAAEHPLLIFTQIPKSTRCPRPRVVGRADGAVELARACAESGCPRPNFGLSPATKLPWSGIDDDR